MRTAWILTVLLAAAGPALADEPKPINLPLTVFDVLNLKQQGLPEDAIIAQIRETNTRCKLAPNDVSMLKLFGVSDRVVAAMAGGPQPAQEYASEPAPRMAKLLSAPSQPTSTKPVGSWMREAGPVSVRVTITDDRFTGTASFDDGDEHFTLSFDADYSVNREGLLYGVITGVDCDNLECGAMSQMLVGHTFSMRCRCEGETLSVREVKFCGSGLKDAHEDEIGMLALAAAGKYRKDDGKPRTVASKPALRKPTEGIVPAVRREIVPGPDGLPIEKHGIDFNRPRLASPPMLPPPPLASSGPVMLPPPPLASSGPVLFPPPLPSSGPVMLPPVPVAGPVYSNPPMTAPVAPAASNSPTGTWVRERSGTRVTMKLTDRRLKIDVAFAIQEGKDVQRGTWHFDADCAIGPDGSVFGVITGSDLTPGEETPADKVGDVATAGMLASKMVGEMFRFRFRVDDGELSLRELKMNLPGGQMDERGMAAMNLVFVGRYKSPGDKPLPPLKPGTMPLPGPSHLTPERIHGGISY